MIFIEDEEWFILQSLFHSNVPSSAMKSERILWWQKQASNAWLDQPGGRSDWLPGSPPLAGLIKMMFSSAAKNLWELASASHFAVTCPGSTLPNQAGFPGRFCAAQVWYDLSSQWMPAAPEYYEWLKYFIGFSGPIPKILSGNLYFKPDNGNRLRILCSSTLVFSEAGTNWG